MHFDKKLWQLLQEALKQGVLKTGCSTMQANIKIFRNTRNHKLI